uniref:DUF4817 domain-containing protein n=1 Tax=Strigamia maritima TaxID=126957 RepID=T1II02_STRMM
MTPHTFTNEIFVELLLLYFRNGENQSKASQLYAELHPDQPAPSHKVVGGSVQEIKHGRPKSATAENNTIDVLASVEVEPKLSVRQRAQASGISKNSVCRILKTNKIHPYKTRFVQELLDRDPVNRLQFCRWTAQQIEQDPHFYKKIIFTDESTFVRHGQVSRHWTYHWSKTNLHNFAHAHSQHIEKLNVWCAIWDDVVIGPFFINGNLIGERYRDLLNNQVWPVLEPLLDANADMNRYFMQDGAPPHFQELLVNGWMKNFQFLQFLM